MKQALYVDCCIRGEKSRTRRMAEAFFEALPAEYEVAHLDLMEEQPRALVGELFSEREELLQSGRTATHRFDLARQLAQTDLVVVAAPFWDLSFPALLKIYIENVCVEGLTFKSTEDGLVGLCRGSHFVYLVSRGGIYPEGDEMEQGTRYLRAMQRFFGFGDFACVAADGLDIQGMDQEAILREACGRAAALAKRL